MTFTPVRTNLDSPRKGFTLPEMLAVIALIVIIISLLMPAFRRAKWESVKGKCMAQMRQISISSRAYSVDNSGYLIRARSQIVQIAINPPERELFANYGYPYEHWECPGREYTPTYEPGFDQLVIAYQYFGGITSWRTLLGTFPSKSPIRMSTSGSRWVVAADTAIKAGGAWGADRTSAYADLPSHKWNQIYPEGGNHTYVDGSAEWVPFKDMYMLHSWSPSNRECFFYQKDLPDGMSFNTAHSARDEIN